MSIEQAWDAGVAPIREFMSRQIDMAGNDDDVMLFQLLQFPTARLPTISRTFRCECSCRPTC